MMESILKLYTVLRMAALLDGFPSVSYLYTWHDVEMHMLCLLTSMELILIPNCGLLCLDYNDMNCFKICVLKKKL